MRYGRESLPSVKPYPGVCSLILLGEEWEVFVLFERAINACKRDGLLEKGDVTVITSGVPIGRSGTTNMLKVQVVD